MLQPLTSPAEADGWLALLRGHWPELLIGLVVVLAVKGDRLWRLIKGGRAQEQTERDAAIEREVAPLRKVAAANERLAAAAEKERQEVARHLAECEADLEALHHDDRRMREELAQLRPLQPEVLRLGGEIAAIREQLRKLEHEGGGRRR